MFQCEREKINEKPRAFKSDAVSSLAPTMLGNNSINLRASYIGHSDYQPAYSV